MSDDWRDHVDDPKTPVLMTEWGKDQLAQFYGWAMQSGYDPANEYIEREDDSVLPPGTNLPEGMVSPNFKLSEFACKHCGAVKDPPMKLVGWLEDIRSNFGGKPVTITSGYRCPTHNAAVGGATQSLHMKGVATDIKVQGVTPAAVFDYVDDLVGADGGASKYPTFVHLDSRGYKARW